MAQNGPGRLPCLDGLRAVAVLIVVAYHSGLGNFGDLGVSIFFVLSGFLITHLLLNEESKTGTVSLRAFYWRRTLRIFPAYYCFIAASFAFDSLRHIPWKPGMLLAGVTYTLDYYNSLIGNFGPIGHGWSLAIEEQFYLLWPLAFIGLRRRKEFLIAVIALVCVWRSALYFNGASNHWLYNSFDCRADNLAVGCLLAVLAIKCVGHLALSFVPPLLIAASRYFGNEAYHYSVGFTVEALLIGVWLVQILNAPRWWKWLDWKPLAFIGTISYPIYLYHPWATGAANRISHDWRFPIALVIVIALAAFSYFVIERPFLKLKDRITDMRSTGTYTPSRQKSIAAT
jgi:peptidoglycan/LPS O-acetylase OafA/YrhL